MNITKFKNLYNKKILITGATGIVGFNLCKELKKIPCEIHVNYLNDLDNNFKELDQSIVHHQFDITNIEKINNLPQFDIIFHCSGYGQPLKFTTNPEKTFLLNTLSLSYLLDKVCENGSFIFLSTSEIYAESNENHEDCKITVNPFNSRNCYILSKLFGETMLSLTSKKINHKIIRLCLCYGPGFKNSDKRVLSEFIMKGVDKKEIALMDDGSDIRSYIYIDDCIEGIFNILLQGKHNLYNIGGKDLLTIYNLAEVVGKITNATVKTGEKKNKLKNSPNKACVDITRYESEFGVLNKTNLYDGIKKCVEWYNNYE